MHFKKREDFKFDSAESRTSFALLSHLFYRGQNLPKNAPESEYLAFHAEQGFQASLGDANFRLVFKIDSFLFPQWTSFA